MRIVLASHHFDQIGGSETYLLTIADQLLRLGHEVTIYANDIGRMAELACSWGINVASELDDLRDPIDIIVSQDGIVAYELSERAPRTPQIFVCHSPFHEQQSPPSIPGIVSVVVVMSDRIERRVRALGATHQIVRLRQPIDVERLVPRRTPRESPRRALLLSNYLSGERRRVLVDAWTSAGIEVMQIGAPADTASLHPEQEIAEADIVVGKGRAILDAMSCGRPSYVYDAYGTDGWVTPQTYPLMEADAFAGLALSRVLNVERLRRDLADYDPLMGQANRELIMTHHHARRHAEHLVCLCRELAPAASSDTTPKRELARVIRAKWRAESELFKLRNEFAAVADRAMQATEQAARVTEMRTLIDSRRVRIGLALGRASDWLRSFGKR